MDHDERAKADLLRYLQQGRDALLWKLEGLSEYDVRRPMTATGTNAEPNAGPGAGGWVADRERLEAAARQASGR